MKKATTVLGIITSFFLAIGIVFKIQHWFGGGIAMTLGVFPIGFTFLLLFLIYNLKQNNSGTIKTAQAIGVFAGFIYSTGILFKVQHWPGGGFISFVGMVSFLFIFIPFYFIALSAKDSPLKKINIHSGIILLLIGILLTAEANKAPSSAIIESQLAFENNEHDQIIALTNSNEILLAGFEIRKLNGPDSLVIPYYNKAFAVSKLTFEMNKYIEHLKIELLRMTEMIDTITSVQYALHPDNVDIPTHYMIGSSSEESNGKAEELLEKLKDFQAAMRGLLPQDKGHWISSFTNDHYSIWQERMISWGDYNFYHFTLAGVIASLTQVQLQVKLTENKVLMLLIEDFESSRRKAQFQNS